MSTELPIGPAAKNVWLPAGVSPPPPEPTSPRVNVYVPLPPVAWNESWPPGTVPVNAGVMAIRAPTLSVAAAVAPVESVTSTTSCADPSEPAAYRPAG